MAEHCVVNCPVERELCRVEVVDPVERLVDAAPLVSVDNPDDTLAVFPVSKLRFCRKIRWTLIECIKVNKRPKVFSYDCGL